MIHFITGGVRSGKSRHAMELAKSLSDNPVYLATARRWDDDFDERIEKHAADRDDSWELIEKEREIGEVDFSKRVVVIDCVTLWLTNYWMDTNQHMDDSLDFFKKDVDGLLRQDATFIVISNELGMGLHAENETGRKFADLQGWANQYVADKAEKATFMVSGLPINIK